MSDLQSRFSRLAAHQNESTPQPPTEGTTTAQKQAALKTAAAFHKDPGSVSVADARSAASTFNNFRLRHGDQVAAGAKTANSLNQKYGVADRLSAHTRTNQPAEQTTSSMTSPAPVPPSPLSTSMLGKKKAPPPPPRKRAGLHVPAHPSPPADDEPPPLPMATKPRF
jgi:hypothetical protein